MSGTTKCYGKSLDKTSNGAIRADGDQACQNTYQGTLVDSENFWCNGGMRSFVQVFNMSLLSSPPLTFHRMKENTSLLCISTSFWVLAAPKIWLNYFFQPFVTFFLHFELFSVISQLKSTKNV